VHAGKKGKCKLLRTSSCLFGEQTEGPVWLEFGKLEGVVGREIKAALGE
jgi:hypothetical protein